MDRAGPCVDRAGVVARHRRQGPLFAWLHRFVFGFQAVRAPARLGVLVACGLAILAARGATTIARRYGHRWAVVLLAVMCVVRVDALAAGRPPRIEDTCRAVAREGSGDGVVLYLPLTNDARANTVSMVDSLQHGRPIVNGYRGNGPRTSLGWSTPSARFPTADALWALHDLDVRFVVAPAPLAPKCRPMNRVEGLLAVEMLR